MYVQEVCVHCVCIRIWRNISLLIITRDIMIVKQIVFKITRYITFGIDSFFYYLKALASVYLFGYLDA